MQIVLVKTKKQKRLFKKFRKDLYRNDPYYVSTVEFTLDMLLYKETAFAKSIDIYPVMGMQDGKILITALLIHHPKDDYLQVSFFESLENIDREVDLFMDYVKDFAKKLSLPRIMIGLNGHLSYGVGLSLDMHCPNTFDSTYTKLYYNQYFDKYPKQELMAFSNKPSLVIPALPTRRSKVTVRKIDLKHFEEEMERFRIICNQTIGTTFLFTQTDRGHFYDLLKPMTFFLRPENILFAEHDGEVVGFVFWHPDYNEVLKKGRQNSLLEIAIRYTLCKRNIKKVKLNSIGVKKEYQGVATVALLREVGKLVENYDTVETNFVWANNQRSMAANQGLLKHVERKFAVYEVKV